MPKSSGIPKKDRVELNALTRLKESYRCKGRIRAEGKKAKPPVCFRPKTEGKGHEKITILELHSRVTGRQIGFYGGRQAPIVHERGLARTWDYLNGNFAADEFRWFLADTRQKTVTNWNRNAKEGLRHMEREARKK